MQTMIWTDGKLELLNQTKLPKVVEYIKCDNYEIVAEAIKKLEVRGAPAIGAAAAFGMVLGAKTLVDENCPNFHNELMEIDKVLRATRPTAVNLFWALDRMGRVIGTYKDLQPSLLAEKLEAEALAIYADDKKVNNDMAKHGATLFTKPTAILTHCNAGALATAGFGTALGVIYAAQEAGKDIRVIANETRPFLQGARLTAYELQQEGVPVTIACDNACGLLMRRGMVQKVVVGADRIAANGDTANKIGTYGVALMAKAHGIPFYIAAPLSTIDRAIPDGSAIPIEERTPLEVTHIGGVRITPEDVPVFNYAFDVTPSELISGIITEKGILRPPYAKSIAAAFAG